MKADRPIMNKKILFGLFIGISMIQLFVPFKMIARHENILSDGEEYLFVTAPVDPSDPFRGKYITLNYRNNSVYTDTCKYEGGEEVYLGITVDTAGFANFSTISQEITQGNYLKTTVRYCSYYEEDTARVYIEMPFNRFYMDEFKAGDAEYAYVQANADPNSVTYAVVSIQNGDAVLKEVMIDGVPIADIAKTIQLSNKNNAE